MLPKFRQPIAARLFLTVLSTTLIITLVGMGLLHIGMQKGFARYVAEVEMQKLDNLSAHLVKLYVQYGSWPAVLADAQKDVQQSSTLAGEDYKTQWLRYQHLLVQRDQKEKVFRERQKLHLPTLENHPEAYPPVPPPFPPVADFPHMPPPPGMTHMPPQPGMGGKPPLFAVFDHLGLGKRLVLYDQNHQYVAGLHSNDDLPTREIKLKGQIIGYLAVKPVVDSKDVPAVNFTLAQSRYLIVISLICLVVSAVVSLLLAAHFRDPIKSLLDTASELIKGNYNQQILIKRHDELGDLAQVMNTLSHILYQHEQSRKQWVADTSHELRTPISVLQVQIEAMQDGIRQATPEHLDAMQRQVLILKKLVQDLNELSQADVGRLRCNFVNTDPWPILQQEVESFQHKYLSKGLTLELLTVEKYSHKLHIDPDRLRQIIINLLENSWRYTETPGLVRVSCEQDASNWYMHVDDTPPNVPDEALLRLGERFYRVDHSRTRDTGGSGLGLALSRQIAEALGGHLLFTQSALGGLRVTLSLPLRPANS